MWQMGAIDLCGLDTACPTTALPIMKWQGLGVGGKMGRRVGTKSNGIPTHPQTTFIFLPPTPIQHPLMPMMGQTISVTALAWENQEEVITSIQIQACSISNISLICFPFRVRLHFLVIRSNIDWSTRSDVLSSVWFSFFGLWEIVSWPY